MQRNRVLASIVGTILLASALTGTGQAATAVSPVPTTNIPKLQLSWLASLSASPASVTVGGDVIGTLTLMRPAIENLKVTLVLEGGAADDMGVQVASAAMMPMNLVVPTGASSASFKITTFAKSGVTLPKTYTITARYGNESKSGSFTVANLHRIQVP